jgi:phage terminase large subunit-like protein
MEVHLNKQLPPCHRKQKEFLDSNALYRAFVGGIGSGKSWCGAFDMNKRAVEGPPGNLYMVIAPTYPLLSTATFRSFESVADEMGTVDYSEIKRSPPPSMILRNGAEILFRSGEHPDMLRGPNLAGIWLDEASLMKEEVFKVAIGRLRQGGLGWLTATFTPKGKQHWTYKTFATGKDNTAIFYARTWENPFLHPEFHEIVGKQYTLQDRRQELEGVFLEGGGGHFRPEGWPRYIDTGDAWRINMGARTYHYRKAECTIILALDWAQKGKKDSDHTAFVVAALTNDGRLFILAVFNRRLRYEENGPALAEWCRVWRPELVVSDDDMLSDAMSVECRRFRDIPEIRRLEISGRSKLVRAQAGIIRAENHLVYLPDPPQAWQEEACDRLSGFTGADDQQDDIPDCFGILGRLADELKPGDVEEIDEPLLAEPGKQEW